MCFVRHRRIVVVSNNLSLSAITPTIPISLHHGAAILIHHGLLGLWDCGSPHLVVVDPHPDLFTWLVRVVITSIHYKLDLPRCWVKCVTSRTQFLALFSRILPVIRIIGIAAIRLNDGLVRHITFRPCDDVVTWMSARHTLS